MIRWWRNFWDGFLNNEAYFIARVRAVVFLISGFTAAEAKTLAEAFNTPGLEKWVIRIGLIGGAVSVLMRAGDKTPENVKAMADAVEDHDPRAHQ